MPNRFSVTDPRGYQVTCPESSWEHLTEDRSWMDTPEWEHDIKQAVKNPTMGIYRDADFDIRCVYYTFHIHKKNRYLKVVVEVDDTSKTGVIVTAYPVVTPKAGEKLLWPTSKA